MQGSLLDIPKLIFQSTTLITYLHEGFPKGLVFLYMVLLMINWAVSFYRFKTRHFDHHHTVTRLFYLYEKTTKITWCVVGGRLHEV